MELKKKSHYTLCVHNYCQLKIKGAGKMAPGLRVFAALAEDWGSDPSTHMVVHNHLYLQL